MVNFPILGKITAEEFLSDYWQQRPLLIRNAIANFSPPIDGNELAGLALEPEVESRLVMGDQWQVEHGPFSEQRFQHLEQRNWTLLVQAVDLWVPEVAEILRSFSFLPPWRIDDIMVSYAADGGNVGPHFDNYDVFLLQGAGQRKWSVGGLCDNNSVLLPHADLRILADNNFTEEWTLNCGDMLYLPPRYSHHGVAIGECTTFSIGFRAPSATEILDDLTTELISQNKLLGVLTDPPLTPAMANQPISPAYIEQIRALINHSLSDDDLLMRWFAQFMTRPKYPQLTSETGESRSARIKTSSQSADIYYKNGEPD